MSRALLEGKLGKHDPELQSFLTKLTPVEKKQIEQYLQGNMAEGEQLLLKKASTHVQDVIALYKEEISELFPMTVQKKLNQHYGKVQVIEQAGEEAERIRGVAHRSPYWPSPTGWASRPKTRSMGRKWNRRIIPFRWF